MLPASPASSPMTTSDSRASFSAPLSIQSIAVSVDDELLVPAPDAPAQEVGPADAVRFSPHLLKNSSNTLFSHGSHQITVSQSSMEAPSTRETGEFSCLASSSESPPIITAVFASAAASRCISTDDVLSPTTKLRNEVGCVPCLCVFPRWNLNLCVGCCAVRAGARAVHGGPW